MKNKHDKTRRKLTASIIILIVLAVCFCLTTSALVRILVIVEDNYYKTGLVKINLNDGEPVICEDEFLFEPGMTVVKPFFIKNESSDDVYYRFYFNNVSGYLAEVLEITIKRGEEVIYEGKMREISSETSLAPDDVLRLEERLDFEIYFHYPRIEGNRGQAQVLTFDFCAEAVQVRNNPSRLFK